MLRGRGLELVDAKGQVRAECKVEPNGEALFRMRDSGGTIRVKLGADDNGSGLLLTDETTEPGVQIIARRSATADRPAHDPYQPDGRGWTAQNDHALSVEFTFHRRGDATAVILHDLHVM